MALERIGNALEASVLDTVYTMEIRLDIFQAMQAPSLHERGDMSARFGREAFLAAAAFAELEEPIQPATFIGLPPPAALSGRVA
ncbi:MAG: hypothetical protein AAF730_14000 [Bacteroidota bacterium]